MNSTLLLLLIYVIYIFIWGLVNILVYFFAVAFKKPSIFYTLAGLGMVVAFLFNLIAGIGLIYIGGSLLFDGKILLFFLFLFFGAGLISFFLNLVQLPFYAIPAYFTAKIEEKDFSDTVVTRTIDESGAVISISEGDTAISVRMAKYFVFLYLLSILPYFTTPDSRLGMGWGDYIIMPFIGIFIVTLLMGLPYAIYRKFRYKSFFPQDKRLFYTIIWKVCFYIYLALTIFILIFAE